MNKETETENQQEHIEITAKVPMPVWNFFIAYWNFVGFEGSPQQFFSEKLSQSALAFVKSMVIDEITDSQEDFIDTYGLEAYREEMGFPKHKED